MGKNASKKRLLRGSLITLRRKCGKPNCRCADGELHETPALSYSVKGTTRMIALRPGDVPEVKKALARYQRAVSSLEERAARGIEKLRQHLEEERISRRRAGR